MNLTALRANAACAFSIGMKAIVVAFDVVVGFSAIAIMLRTLRWRRHVESDREPHPIRASMVPEPEASST